MSHESYFRALREQDPDRLRELSTSGGRTRAERLSPERRAEIAASGGQTRSAKYTTEEWSALLKAAHARIRAERAAQAAQGQE